MNPPEPDARPPSRRRTRAVIVAATLAAAVLVIRWAATPRMPTTTVTGTVTSGGRAVVFGTVTLIAADRRAYAARIGADGRFAVTDVPAGPVQIAVSSPDPRPSAAAAARARGERAGDVGSGTAATREGGDERPREHVPPGTTIAAPLAGMPPGEARSPRHEGWFRIPGRYANPATSGLDATVEPGGNRLDLRVD